MKSKLPVYLKYFAFFCVGLFLLWLSLRKQDLGEIKEKLKNANYFWALAAVLMGVLSNYSRAIRWNILVEPTGYKPKTINTFAAVQVGYFANLAIPRLGEVTRCVVLNRYEKVPMNTLIGTVVVERIVDVIALFLLLLLTLFLQFNLLSGFANTLFFHPIEQQLLGFLNKGIAYYFIAFSILAVLIFIGWLAFKKFRQTALYARLFKLLKGFGDGLRTIGRLKNPGMFLFHTAFIWFAYTMSTYLCFMSFDFTAHLGFMPALTGMVFGGLGFVAPIPGAVGIYQAIIQQTMMLYGLDGNQASAFANLSWAGQTFAVIFFGILLYLLLPLFNRNTATVANEQA